MLEALAVSARTLTNYCQAGTVERRKVGRKSVYRLVNRGKEATQSEQRGNMQARGGAFGTLALAPIARGEPSRAPAMELTPHVHLVEQLTADLARASGELGEAVGIAWSLSEQRDELTDRCDDLAGRLVRLQRELHRLTDSPLTLPVRHRLLSVLRDSLH